MGKCGFADFALYALSVTIADRFKQRGSLLEEKDNLSNTIKLLDEEDFLLCFGF